jgi:hypothetical protein
MHSVPPPKKAYQPPKLLIYGDLSEITKQGGKGGMDRTTSSSMT